MNVVEKVPSETNDGWSQSSTCRAVEEAGRIEGREYGLAESTSRTLASLLGRQARAKFGRGDEAGRATLDGLARAFARERLIELGEGLVESSGWDAWLAGVMVPPPAGDRPAYTKDPEINLEPPSPSIDTYFEVGQAGGGTMIVHIRLQKCYQPDLDRHLFEESRKVERKRGKMPMVGVFLMRPAAEGPGTSGRFEQRDAAGKVTSVFTYTIRRAWEMSPEEVTQSPGTMMLAPLARGARERMPEIVRMIADGLERNRVDACTQQKVWAAVYWAMGFTCDLEEAHCALGGVVPLIHATKDYLQAKGQAFLEAYSSAQREGRLQAGRDLVVRQGTRRFGPNAAAGDAIASVVEPSDLDALADRVLCVANWSSLLNSDLRHRA
jgi:hypothetical protein